MINGIVLAAGEGKRYGKPKALAVHNNETFLEHQYKLLKPFCDSLIIVIGASACEVKEKHKYINVTWCENLNWKHGQFSSL